MKKYIFGTLIGLGAFTIVGGGIAAAHGFGFGGPIQADRAELLGMTTEELQAALQEKTMPELLDEQGISHTDMMQFGTSRMIEEKAALLDMTTDELAAALDEKTFPEILDDQGVSHTEFMEMRHAQHQERVTERLQQLLDEGIITESEMQERLDEIENHDGYGLIGPGHMHGGGMGQHHRF